MATYLVVDVQDLCSRVIVFEFLQNFFDRNLVARFFSHKVFHENWSRRSLKLKKTEGESQFGLTWLVHVIVFLLWKEEDECEQCLRCL